MAPKKDPMPYLVVAAILIKLAVLVFLGPWDLAAEPKIPNDPAAAQSIFESSAGRDDIWYHRSAMSMLSGEHVTPYRSLGYPLFLSLVYYAFGERPWTALVVQSILGALSVYLVYLLGMAAFKDRAAALSGSILYILDATSAYYAVSITSEQLFITVLLFAIVLLLRSLRSDSLASPALTGALFGLCVHVRAIALLLPLFCACILLPKRGVKVTGVFALAFMLAVAPTFVSNYLHYGHLAFTSGAGAHQCSWMAAYASSREDGIERGPAASRLCRLLDAPQNPFDASARKGEIARGYMLAHPASSAKAWLGGMHDFLFADPIGLVKTRYAYAFTAADPVKAYDILDPLHSLYQTLLYGLSLAGFAFSFRERGTRPSALLFLGIIIYFAILSGPAGGLNHGRFRVPAQPFIALLAAYGISSILSRLHGSKGMRRI